MTQLAAAALCWGLLCAAAGGEPPLPAGLEPARERAPAGPALPQGLGEAKEEGPTLPLGLGLEEKPPPPPERERTAFPLDLSGFWEVRYGGRLRNDPFERDTSLAETRLQLSLQKRADRATFRLAGDLLYDDVSPRRGDVDLEAGTGFFDLRQANVSFSPFDFMDIKAGRQILTWGTGDLFFINDLFPKDWHAFFIGRDIEYLKAPSDAVKISLFGEAANLDIVYVPRFDPDRFIDGSRLSYYNPILGRRAGRDGRVRADPPERWLRDDEVALRLYRNLAGTELAVYAYDGFWKSPAGFDPATGRATFPDLSVYGASARRPMFGGLANIEVGYYDSREDRAGDDPFLGNSEWRALAGYERDLGTLFPGREWAKDFTVGTQYYLERMEEYGAYRRTLPPGARARDRERHVLTLRLTRLLLKQDLRLSLFAYYSPSDRDAYLRPNVHYKIDDHWSVEFGANVLVGSEAHTFFGQFEKNTNLFAGLRWSF